MKNKGLLIEISIKKESKISGIRFYIERYANYKHKDYEIYSSGSKIDYILRLKAILKHSRHPRNSKQSYTSFLQKTRLQRPENAGLININFENNQINYPDPEDAKKKLKGLSKEQFIWDGSISISQKTANRMKFGNQKEWSELIIRYLPSFLKTEKLEPNNIEFYGAVHTNTKNPHIHFIFFEKEPTFFDEKQKKFVFRKKGKIQIEHIRKFEKESFKFIQDESKTKEEFALKKEFWSTKNELKKSIQNYYFSKLDEIIYPVINEIKSHKPKKYSDLTDESKSLVRLYFENQIDELPVEIKSQYHSYKKFLNKNQEKEHFQIEHEKFEKTIFNKIFFDLKSFIFFENSYRFKEQVNTEGPNFNNRFSEYKHKKQRLQIKTYLNKYDYKNKNQSLLKFNQMKNSNHTKK